MFTMQNVFGVLALIVAIILATFGIFKLVDAWLMRAGLRRRAGSLAVTYTDATVSGIVDPSVREMVSRLFGQIEEARQRIAALENQQATAWEMLQWAEMKEGNPFTANTKIAQAMARPAGDAEPD